MRLWAFIRNGCTRSLHPGWGHPPCGAMDFGGVRWRTCPKGWLGKGTFYESLCRWSWRSLGTRMVCMGLTRGNDKVEGGRHSHHHHRIIIARSFIAVGLMVGL